MGMHETAAGYQYAKGGACYRCGRGSPLCDMDVAIEGEGHLALCRPCIQEASEALGMRTNNAVVRGLRARITVLESQLAGAAPAEVSTARFEQLVAALEALTQPAADE